jgi:nucleoside-diphosphate-sugar epimerase
MRLLFAGADTRTGKALSPLLETHHHCSGLGVTNAGSWPHGRYTRVDLRTDPLASVFESGDALVLSAVPEASGFGIDPVEYATMGTYRLLDAAHVAGVKRVVLLSTLDFFDDYPADCLIGESWKPRVSTAP